MVMVFIYFLSGKCSTPEGKIKCECDNGYALPFCKEKTCIGYAGCNHGNEVSL